jgi:hypothetical protein
MTATEATTLRLREVLASSAPDDTAEALRLRAIDPVAWARVLRDLDPERWMRARAVTRLADEALRAPALGGA